MVLPDAAAERLQKSYGHSLIGDAYVNLGTSWPKELRAQRHLQGLLPPTYETLDTQAERVLQQLVACTHDLDRFVLMYAVAASNQILYHHVLQKDLVHLLPIAYTPTVGDGCINHHRIHLKPPGLYFSAWEDEGHFETVLEGWPHEDVQIIVLTDGGRILGLGDLGVNGMGISMGKIALYVAGGGFRPDCSLPACIDVGTDNAKLRDDPLYMGSRSPRLHGERQLEAVEALCHTIHTKWPHCLVQFEDFETDAAVALLERLRDKLPCWNDDIQGTAVMVAAGCINGFELQQTPLSEARIVIYGAGSSSVGVARLLQQLLVHHGKLDDQQAHKAIYVVDTKGLVSNHRDNGGKGLPHHKLKLARDDVEGCEGMKDLLSVVRHACPHVLIGLTGAGPSFKQEHVKAMLETTSKPILLPLSNPTNMSEISAEDAIKWSGGECIFASGSPFPPVKVHGEEFLPSQGNNVLSFPGIGFGVVAVKAKTISDTMLLAAADAVAHSVPREDVQAGHIYPKIQDLQHISKQVAVAVARAALSEGLSSLEQPPADVEAHVAGLRWTPQKGAQEIIQALSSSK